MLAANEGKTASPERSLSRVAFLRRGDELAAAPQDRSGLRVITGLFEWRDEPGRAATARLADGEGAAPA